LQFVRLPRIQKFDPSSTRFGNSAEAFCFEEESMSHLFYDPETTRPYIGLRLPAEQLAALDEARIGLRQSRSEFARQAIAAHLRRLQDTAN
jgi:hypothetical protein